MSAVNCRVKRCSVFFVSNFNVGSVIKGLLHLPPMLLDMLLDNGIRMLEYRNATLERHKERRKERHKERHKELHKQLHKERHKERHYINATL